MAGIGESESLWDRVLRYLWRLVRLLLAVAIYALVLWYGVETAQKLDAPPVVAGIAVALIALGIAGSTYRILIDVAKEAKGSIMALAAFLNDKLVEPQRRRLRAEGREEGRAEGRAETITEGRARLIEQGIDPDLIFPLDGEADNTDEADH
jgi:hypothetical protein